MRRVGSAVGIAGLVALLGCGGGDDGTGGGTPGPSGPSTFDVTWAPAARVIDEAAGKARLMGPPPTAATLVYRFSPDAQAIAALEPGQIAVLAGIGYRRVVGVSMVDGALELRTERTTLPQAIRSGTLAWDQTVDFTRVDMAQAAVTIAGQALEAVRGLALAYQGQVDGFDVNLTLTPSPSRLDISAVVTKEIAGQRRFGVEATGHISGFRTAGRAVVRDGATIEFEAGQRQIEGELKIKAAAFNTGASQNLLSIPLGIDIPVQIGPVPLMLKLKVNVNVTAELGVANSSAQAEATFRFRSNQGVSLAGTRLVANANLESGDFADFRGGSADMVAAGLNTCIEAPRVELSMLGEFASVGFTQNNCASTVFTFDPPCNEVNGAITGIALANLGFFGVTLAAAQVELYKREDGLRAGMCRR